MRLFHITQESQKVSLANRERHQQQESGDLIKLLHPVMAPHHQRALHRELLFFHRRGLLLRAKPELQYVLERRQREQNKLRELGPPSDLEVKLCTRLQKTQAYELEEKRRSEGLQDVPEFVRVRGALKHVHPFSS